MRTLIWSMALVGAVAATSACQKKDNKPSAPSGTTAIIAESTGDGPELPPVSGDFKLVVGASFLATTDRKDLGVARKVPAGEASFTERLLPKLQASCSCHDDAATSNFPFAASGAPQAFLAAKVYLTASAADSKMIQNIRGGHNDVSSSLEAEFAPVIEEIAGEIAGGN